MNDSRRTLLLFAFAVSRGMLSAEEAAQVLSRLRGSSAAALRSGASMAQDALGPWWSHLEERTRDGLLTEIRELEADEGRAELLVANSPIADAEKRAWWGEDASQVGIGDVVVDIDFSAGVTSRGTSSAPHQPRTLPRLSPEERYQVQREVARGGMGRILLAKDVTLGRNVAVKEILSGGEEEGAAPEDVERFLREARITGQLEHPNIVPVHELGQRTDGRMYYTMKLVRGETMEKRLGTIQRDERLTDGEKLAKRLKLLDAFVDVCQALAYAHTRGVVNRDLKPSNVMLGDFGETVVLDWGLARVAGTEDRARKDVERVSLTLNMSVNTTGSSKLTMDGAIMGTPAYMSPEQARGEIEDVDEKSDVYSLGAILYEIVTGVPPFVGPSALDVVRAVGKNQEPPRVGAVERLAPRELEVLIQHAMAKDKSRRLKSAKLLAEEILAFRDGRALSTFTYTGFQQVSRWIRRHKGLTAGIAAAAVAMIGGTIASTYYAKNASVESRNARDAEKLAMVQADRAAKRAQEAEAAARKAEGLRLAAKARVQVTKNPAQALWLAIRGAELESSSETNSALFDSLSRISERRRLYGAESYVIYATFSPDGTRVAAGEEEGAVRIWDARTGQELYRLDGHTNFVTWLAWNSDGSRLASAAKDGFVRLWNPSEGKAVAALRGHGEAARGAWSADGKTLVTWGGDIPARAWDADGGGAMAMGESPAAWAAVSPDGRRIATATAKGVEIHQRGGAPALPPLEHRAAVLGVAWTPDGREVVAAGVDGALRTWNSETGAPRLDVELGKDSPLRDLSVSPDSALAVVRAGNTQRILRLADGSAVLTVDHAHDFQPLPMSPDWKRFIRQDSPTDFVVVDVATGAVTPSFSGHSYGVRHVEWSRDGRQLVSASSDMTAAVWDADPGREMPWLPVPRDGGGVIDVDADNQRMLAMHRSTGALSVVDMETGSVIREIHGPVTGEQDAMMLADGNVLSWVVANPVLRVQDARTGREVRILAPVEGTSCVGAAEYGGVVVARFRTTDTDQLRVWDPAGAVLGTFTPVGSTQGFAPSPDGKWVVAANGSEGTATLYDVKTGERAHVVSGHTGFVLNVAFLGDGSRFMTAAVDATCRVWDTKSGKLLSTLSWPRVENLRPVPNPPGTAVWVFGLTEARLFDTATGRRLAQVECRPSAMWGTWKSDSTVAYFGHRDSSIRRIPADPLPAARRALPRDLAPFELNDLEIGNPEERAALIRKFSEGHPSAIGAERTGWKALGEDRIDDAERHCRRSLEIYPRFTQSHLLLAVIQARRAAKEPEGSAARKKNIDEGLAALRQALEYGLHPDRVAEMTEELGVLKSDPRWAETAGTRPER